MDVSDDQVIDLEELRLRGEYHEEAVADVDLLEEEAVSVQRICVSRLTDRYVSGTMSVVHVSEDRKVTQEKKFSIAKLIDWSTPDPDVLLEELSRGRVRCRLQARMGMGKSTRLPFLIANRLTLRVLHVTISAHCLQHANDYNNARGTGHYCKRWSGTKRSLVCCMTYADFNGYMIGTDRDTLFKSFDVLFFDEGFVESVDVKVCKTFLAVYASADVSIIVASATISTDSNDGDGGAQGLGNFKTVDKSQTVDAIANNPKLVSDWVVDRVAIFCPDYDSISMMRDTCEREGLDVRVLDDASTTSDEVDVSKWLSGDASTLRVVILHSRYGIGHNVPLSFTLIFALEQKLRFVGDVVEYYLVPMDSKMVTQVQSRSGRKIVDGSGGIIFTTERQEQALDNAQKVEAFVWLSAGSVVPSKNDYWKCAYDLFPDGLAAVVAVQLLKSCLHPQIVAKFLAQDGLVASKYVRAMNIFALPDHFFRPSKYDLPVSYASWPEQTLYGTSTQSIKVPYKAVGELQVAIQAISAITGDIIRVERWRPMSSFVMHDGYDSDDGVKPETVQRRFRRVEHKPLPVLPVEPVTQIPWSYRRGEITDNRQGGVIDKVRLREGLDSWTNAVQRFQISLNDVEVVQDSISSVSASAVDPVYGSVESPGGSTFVKLPMEMCRQINEGKVLSPDMFMQLILLVRSNGLKFAQSKMFDCFSHPWDSFFGSLLEGQVVRAISSNGYATDVYAIANWLRARFSAELSAVVTSSNVFKNAYKSLFKRTPNMDKIMDAIRRGQFDGIAQSEEFISRVKTLKFNIDRSLLYAEQYGIYLPQHITAAQRSMPIRGANVLGYENDNLRPMPTTWSDSLSNHSRGSSSLSFRTK